MVVAVANASSGDSGHSGRTDCSSEEVDCISKKARPTEQMTERQTVNFLMRPINLSA